MTSKTRPVKSPAGRALRSGGLKVGRVYEVDVRTGKIVPPRPRKRKKQWQS
jgi:hypothetical protein